MRHCRQHQLPLRRCVGALGRHRAIEAWTPRSDGESWMTNQSDLRRWQTRSAGAFCAVGRRRVSKGRGTSIALWLWCGTSSSTTLASAACNHTVINLAKYSLQWLQAMLHSQTQFAPIKSVKLFRASKQPNPLGQLG